jgi:hypothetical protein
VFALASSALLLVPGAASASLSPAGIVAKLNQERAALGIPPVTLNAKRTAACRAHNNYMRRNHSLGHVETPGLPGYSRAGERAARMSVLAAQSSWARHNPWRNAPIHLGQVYNPGLRSTGASDNGGYSCLFTYPNTRRQGSDKIWTLPADGGSVVHAQTAFEAPAPPQSTVGIPAGRKTGPYLYVWSAASTGALAPVTRLLSGTLIGPSGPVNVKVIDSSLLGGLAQKGNGWLLPVKPLAANATYTATVVLGPSLGVRRLTHSWSFRTTSGSLVY